MNILESTRLHWNISDGNLNNAAIDHHHITPVDLETLNQPIQLKTPNLILFLAPMENTERVDVEFATGSVVTPLQILGAIYTYYSLPVSNEGFEVTRMQIMDGLNLFMGIGENDDGSFNVSLGI